MHAKSMKEKLKMALTYLIYKSIVDISKLTFNNFMTIYAPELVTACGTNEHKLEELIDQANKIYLNFAQDDRQNATSLSVNHTQAIKTVLANSKPQMILSPITHSQIGSF